MPQASDIQRKLTAKILRNPIDPPPRLDRNWRRLAASATIVSDLEQHGPLDLFRHTVPDLGRAKMAKTLVRQRCLPGRHPLSLGTRTIELSLIHLHTSV